MDQPTYPFEEKSFMDGPLEILFIIDESFLFEFKWGTFSIGEKNTTTKHLPFKVFIFQSFGPYQINELRRFNK